MINCDKLLLTYRKNSIVAYIDDTFDTNRYIINAIFFENNFDNFYPVFSFFFTHNFVFSNNLEIYAKTLDIKRKIILLYNLFKDDNISKRPINDVLYNKYSLFERKISNIIVQYSKDIYKQYTNILFKINLYNYSKPFIRDCYKLIANNNNVLTILGSSSFATFYTINKTSIFIKYNNTVLLVDCGYGSYNLYLKLYRNYVINYIFITHNHIDHYSDIHKFIKKNPNIVIYLVKESFVNFCKYIKPFQNIIDINTLDDIHITDNIVINKIYVKHCKNSLGYNINLDNKNILISGDTELTDDLFMYSNKNTIFIHEITGEKCHKNKHTYYKDLAFKIKSVEYKTLILYHLDNYIIRNRKKIINYFNKTNNMKDINLAYDSYTIQI